MTERESYTPGYSRNAGTFMAQRTAQTHAAFVLPCLHAGMRVLDCGCGPGTITLGLARQVAPGEVIGIDGEASQITLAQQQAAEQAVPNARFETASVYALPFPDGTFDLVFSHALFEHLRHPLEALNAIRRVLKPGGIVALRSPDWGGFLVAPEPPDVQRAIAYYQQIQTFNGGDVHAGRKLKSYLRRCGFRDIRASASYECYDPLDRIAEYLAQRIEQSLQTEHAAERAGASEADIHRMADALREWSRHPDGFFAQSWCEVLGYKAEAG